MLEVLLGNQFGVKTVVPFLSLFVIQLQCTEHLTSELDVVVPDFIVIPTIKTTTPGNI